MRNFPPDKIMNAKGDRVYQKPTDDVGVFLVRRGQNKVVQEITF